MKTAAGGAATAAALDTGADPLGEFGSESGEEHAPFAVQDAAVRPRRNWVVWALALVALAQMPVVALWVINRAGSPGATTGTVHIESTPPGAEVRMDGKLLGTTPVALSLDSGDRVLELRRDDVVRPLTVTVRAGEVLRERVELGTSAAGAVALSNVGSLSVTTEPSRAPVFVDGTARGSSPIVIADLAPGDHTVTVRFPSGAVERTIRVDAGATASLVASAPPVAGAVSGWITVDVRQPLQILEDGRLVGTTDISRLMLPAGEHTLDFVNDELGFRTRRTIRVNPGSTTTVPMDLPRAPLAINAQPWASVWLDGQPVGDTPLGNLTPTIGRHEVVFRHPQLGERRASVVVTLKERARIGVDLRRTN